MLVTGSSGFLGRNVALALGGEDVDVVGFDIRPPVGGEETFATFVGDLADPEAVRRACDGVDVIAHFGGVGDVDLAERSPSLAASANVVGTTNVAAAAVEHGARVVYASTWEVYGQPRYQPVDEAHPCDPGHIYAATKLAGELVLRAAHRTNGLRLVVLRLGTAYGPGMRPNSVFSRFAERAMSGENLIVHGDGSQWRQFVHSTDVADATRAALTLGGDGETVNVVADECVTIRELAEVVAMRYGVGLTFAGERSGDPPPALVSSKAAKSLLGWEARVRFRDGLADLLGDREVLNSIDQVAELSV
ncbi:MAG TPA: NAD-dependent epimerase/dehydratase family protein [Acidimicrobiales bacterium]|nr:NAD-dependent epimerase/dehydratase family protein [Acidimicrobiales bacterium]